MQYLPFEHDLSRNDILFLYVWFESVKWDSLKDL